LLLIAIPRQPAALVNSTRNLATPNLQRLFAPKRTTKSTRFLLEKEAKAFLLGGRLDRQPAADVGIGQKLNRIDMIQA
jgi:hypothetical protein